MKIIEVIADARSADTVSAIAEKYKAFDFRLGLEGEDGMRSMRFLVGDDKVQSVLDTLQGVLGAQPYARFLVIPLDIALPRPVEEERAKEDAAIAAREALYDQAERNARLDLNFVVLVGLSTLVAAVGLIENSVAVVIGAMVIAPLLGPNIALGLGTALGDLPLIRKALATSFAGILLAVVLSAAIGVFWPSRPSNPELIARTKAGLDSIVIALASGAAAALSLTTNLPSVLVGVMVSVALLPPAATFGLMLGNGRMDLAIGAGLLLIVNVVCVNLASKLIFLIKGIHPRTWWEKERARHAMLIYLVVWLVSLLILVVIILDRGALRN